MASDNNGWCIFGKVTGITTLVILLLVGGAGAATQVSDCTTISSPGTYILNQSTINSSVNTCIDITSSNVIFDGAGYTIDGIDALWNENMIALWTKGVYVHNSTIALTNVTVKNLKVTDWHFGIYYINVANGSIENNNASSNRYGIELLDSSNNTLTNNNMTGNSFNFGLGGYDYAFNNSIDTSNKVDDNKPILYIKNGANITFDSSTNAGTFYCIWCNNVTVKNLILKNNSIGILFRKTNNSKIENINASSNWEGIKLKDSYNNILTYNTASLNIVGIKLDFSSNNTLINNKASSNEHGGIDIYLSSNNSIYLNNLINNGLCNAFSYNYYPTNFWNSTKPITYQHNGSTFTNYMGNYWSNYTGTDINNDGIGDIPFKICYLVEQDLYPLMSPSVGQLAGGASAVTSIWDEQSGSSLPFTWDYTNFDGFNVSGIGTETLRVVQTNLGAASGKTRTIRDRDDPSGAGLIYTTTRQLIQYEVSKNKGMQVEQALNNVGNKVNFGNYYAKINLLGEPYVGLNGKANKLSKLIIEQNSSASQKKSLTVEETWNVGGGWILTAGAIDAKASPRLVWLVLSYNGQKLDDRVLAMGEVYTYAEKNISGETDVPLFVTYVDAIFAGATTDLVQLRYTWAVSRNVSTVLAGDNFGVFTVIAASTDGLNLENNQNISLAPNTTLNLAGNIKFKVIDNISFLKFYPTFEPAVTIINSCTEITSPGTYVLDQSIMNSGESPCIKITSSSVVFDGAGYTIDGLDAWDTYGVYVYNSTTPLTNVTIKNLVVIDWGNGISYENVANGRMANNSAISNSLGIRLWASGNNTLSSNNMTGNSYNFYLEGYQDSHFDNSIDLSNTVDGKPVFYIKNVENTIFDSSSNIGTLYCIWCNNVTVKNMTLTKNGHGVFFWSTNNSRIENINTSSNRVGIYFGSSRNNTLSNNYASSNDFGILLEYSRNNTLSNNYASLNLFGIWLWASGNNTLNNNNMTGNIYNFDISYLQDSDLNNSIDLTNIVDGKPIFYIKNGENTIFDSSSNIGTLYCIRCNNVTVKNMTLTKNGHGVFFWVTNNSRIENINTSLNHDGIYLGSSSNNTLSNNYASSNRLGIVLLESSSNNTLSNNNASLNNDGIYLDSSSNNTLSNNNASLNHDGIYLFSSSNNTLSNNDANSNLDTGILLRSYSNYNTIINNTVSSNNGGISLSFSSSNRIYHNNFISNTNQAGDELTSANSWDSGYPSGGNYWSDYQGIDANSDGIGDAPYNISGGAGAQDRYPFTRRNGWISAVTKGDVSGDGAITVVDALFVAQYTVGLRTQTSQQLAAADVNGDGQVTVVDALFIAQYTVGLRQL